MSGYRAHVEWIAQNDDFDIGDDDVGYIISVCMTADMFGKEQAEVAKAVERFRKRNGISSANSY